LGGTGKTSLAWKWFTEQSANFQGAMWWSFYADELPAFLMQCDRYLSGNDAGVLHEAERAARVLQLLDSGRFLIVLDGVERLMVGYSPSPPADSHLIPTSNAVRRAASATVQYFLRRLTTLRSGSKILMTSRLAPADLEDMSGRPLRGSRTLDLSGLDAASARELLAELAPGEPLDRMMDAAAAVGYHPLSLVLLAGWVKMNPRELRMESLRHVMRSALEALDAEALLVARAIARFDHPVAYAELRGSLAGAHAALHRESDLDRALTKLENLGLVMWDRGDNTYSIHPIVRASLLEVS
jgi:hypothetical protein